MTASAILDLSSEIAEVRHAVEGVRVMADVLVYESASGRETARLMPRRISALLNLIVARVRLVERALNGSRDPVELVCEHNEAIAGAEGGTQLRPWSPERRREEAQRELRRAKAERRTVRSRRRR